MRPPPRRPPLLGGLFSRSEADRRPRLQLHLLGHPPAAAGGGGDGGGGGPAADSNGGGGGNFTVRGAALQRLSLDFTPPQGCVTDAELAAAAAALTGLRRLELDGLAGGGPGAATQNPGAAGGPALRGPGLAALSRCPRLRNLRLSRCEGIDGPALLHLAEASSLVQLAVLSCPRVGPRDAAALQAAFRSKHGRPLPVTLIPPE